MKPLPGLGGGNLQVSRTAGADWVTFPIETINGAHFSPHDSRVGWIASAGDGLFVTTDGFETLYPVESARELRALMVRIPADDDLIAIGGLKGLFFSHDQGVSWQSVQAAKDSQVADILFVGGERKHILAATRSGVLESTDGGKTWSENNEGLDHRWAMSLLQIDSHIYVGTSGGGVFKRNLQRRNWSAHNLGFPTMSSARVAVSGSHLLSTGLGVFRSSDRGRSWKPLGLAPQLVWSFAVAPTDDAVPRRVRMPALSTSNSGGDTWNTNEPLRGSLLAGTNDSLWVRTAGSDAWSLMHTFPGGQRIREILLSPRNPSLIYVLTDGAGLWRSRDFGRDDWQRIDDESLGVIADLTLRDSDGALVTITAKGDLLRSGDEGTTWSSRGEPFAEDPALAIACSHDSATIFVIMQSGAVCTSSDGGATFEHRSTVEIAERRRWATLFVSPSNAMHVWLGTSHGAYESSDGGRTWTAIQGGLLGERYHVNAFAAHDQALYAAMPKGIFALPGPC